MSTRIMALCWPLQMPLAPKSILISLADNANDDGHCWPSITTISERTCISRRAVIDGIAWLERAKALRADRSNGRHTKYILTPAAFDPPVEAKRKVTRAADAPVDNGSADAAPVQMAHQCESRTGADGAQTSADGARVPVQMAHQPVRQPHTNRQEPSSEPSREPSERGPTRPPNSGRATRIDPELELSLAWQNDAIAIHPTWSPARAEEVFAHFRDHWAAKGGQDARKVDWRAAWRTWCRRERSDPGPGRPHVNRQEAIERSNRAVVERMVAKQRAAAAPYDLMTPAERAEQAFQAAEGPQPFPED